MTCVQVGRDQVRISTDRVGKWFGEVIAVNNCTLGVGAGVVGLLGANGAGKSTLFKMLAGLIEPSHGKVRVSRSMRYPTASSLVQMWSAARRLARLLVSGRVSQGDVEADGGSPASLRWSQ